MINVRNLLLMLLGSSFMLNANALLANQADPTNYYLFTDVSVRDSNLSTFRNFDVKNDNLYGEIKEISTSEITNSGNASSSQMEFGTQTAPYLKGSVVTTNTSANTSAYSRSFGAYDYDFIIQGNGAPAIYVPVTISGTLTVSYNYTDSARVVIYANQYLSGNFKSGDTINGDELFFNEGLDLAHNPFANRIDFAGSITSPAPDSFTATVNFTKTFSVLSDFKQNIRASLDIFSLPDSVTGRVEASALLNTMVTIDSQYMHQGYSLLLAPGVGNSFATAVPETNLSDLLILGISTIVWLARREKLNKNHAV